VRKMTNDQAPMTSAENRGQRRGYDAETEIRACHELIMHTGTLSGHYELATESSMSLRRHMPRYSSSKGEAFAEPFEFA
jgi:hypothetical protein